MLFEDTVKKTRGQAKGRENISVKHISVKGPVTRYTENSQNSKIRKETSGQNGGVGRYASLPRTTKRKTTTNLKTKNNQNCQKIKKLYEVRQPWS